MKVMRNFQSLDYRTECKHCLGHSLGMGIPPHLRVSTLRLVYIARDNKYIKKWNKKTRNCAGCLRIAVNLLIFLLSFLNRLSVRV